MQRSIYDGFMEKLVARTKALRVGDPEAPDTQMAPLIHVKHRDEVAAYVDLARSEGGEVLCGGRAPEGESYAHGNYYLPTILSGLPNSARTCQEEIFGPVLVAMPFDDEDDLLRQANESVFGLAAGIWTPDYRKFGASPGNYERARSGSTPTSSFPSQRRSAAGSESGLGREKGRLGIRAVHGSEEPVLGFVRPSASLERVAKFTGRASRAVAGCEIRRVT